MRAHYDGSYVPLRIDTETGAITQPGLPDSRALRLLRGTGDDSVRQGLMELGYSNIEITQRAGRYLDATAWRYGSTVNLSVDLDTGLVDNLDQDDTWYVAMRDNMTPDEIRTELEGMGYSDVIELNRQGGFYEGYGVQDGQKVKLVVNAETGEVRAWAVNGNS